MLYPALVAATEEVPYNTSLSILNKKTGHCVAHPGHSSAPRYTASSRRGAARCSRPSSAPDPRDPGRIGDPATRACSGRCCVCACFSRSQNVRQDSKTYLHERPHEHLASRRAYLVHLSHHFPEPPTWQRLQLSLALAVRALHVPHVPVSLVQVALVLFVRRVAALLPHDVHAQYAPLLLGQAVPRPIAKRMRNIYMGDRGETDRFSALPSFIQDELGDLLGFGQYPNILIKQRVRVSQACGHPLRRV